METHFVRLHARETPGKPGFLSLYFLLLHESTAWWSVAADVERFSTLLQKYSTTIKLLPRTLRLRTRIESQAISDLQPLGSEILFIDTGSYR